MEAAVRAPAAQAQAASLARVVVEGAAAAKAGTVEVVGHLAAGAEEVVAQAAEVDRFPTIRPRWIPITEAAAAARAAEAANSAACLVCITASIF